MAVSDYQISIGGLVLGGPTPLGYIIHGIDGFGLPGLRSNDVSRPRDHGEFYGLDYMPGRTITITATIRGTSPADAVAKLDALMAVWQPVTPSVEAFSALTYQFPGQAARRFRGRPRRAAPDMTRVVGNRIPIVLEYHTADPRQYADVPTSASVGILVISGGRTYPRTYPLTFGASGSVLISAVNSGNFPTRPVATILGPVTNPRVENVTTGQFVKFGIVLGVADTLTVDFDAKTVVLNGTASRYSTLTVDSTWWEIAPGTVNVRYAADTFDPASLLTLVWSSAWI